MGRFFQTFFKLEIFLTSNFIALWSESVVNTISTLRNSLMFSL